MKNSVTPLILATALLVAFSTDSEAAQQRRRRQGSPERPQAPACGEVNSPHAVAPVKMNQFTGYAPGLGGINGSCRGGASRGKGFLPCRDTLQTYIQGRAKYIHTATQQNGGSASLFGCWAESDDLKKKGISSGNASCHIFAMADRYARSENEGGRGVNGRRTGKKVDIEVGSLDASYRKLAGKGSTDGFKCIGRLPGVQNGEVRRVARNQGARRRVQ